MSISDNAKFECFKEFVHLTMHQLGHGGLSLLLQHLHDRQPLCFHIVEQNSLGVVYLQANIAIASLNDDGALAQASLRIQFDRAANGDCKRIACHLAPVPC